MKTTVNKDQVLIKFYSAVLYMWHPYFPDDLKSISDDLKQQIISDSTSVKTLLLSSSSVSDLIEFAEYKFNFKFDRDSQKEYLLNNFLDSYTRELVGTDFRDLQKVENNVIPQLSTEKRNWDEKSLGYFGGVSLDGDQIYMIDCPENIWKIEIYQEYREGNHIEYSVKESFGLSGLDYKPILTIELGPESTCFNNKKNTELDLYYPGAIYYSFDETKEMVDAEYRALCQEIQDKKVFYIVQTPNEISTINIALASWNSAKVPHRNKKDWNVTNDHFNSAVFNDYNVFTEKYNNSLVDTASMILLGNQKQDLSILPFLAEKLERCYPITRDSNNKNKDSHTFRQNIVYNEGDIVTYKGGKYVSLIDGNIFDSPDISGNWSKLVEGKSILQIVENKKKYKSITVMSDNGNVYPNGNLSAKVINSKGEWYKIFKIEEQLGYLFSNLLIDNSYSFSKSELKGFLIEKSTGIDELYLDQSALKNRNEDTQKLEFKYIDFIFEKTRSKININFIAEEDYYYNKGKFYLYQNELPEGFRVLLNGVDFGSINNGVVLTPGTPYEIEITHDGEYYTLAEGQQTVFKGIANQNKFDINIPIYSREYICSFSGYEKAGIVVNGDSSRVCYYKQSVTIEFSYENDEDAIPNWHMFKKLSINGQTLKNWSSSVIYNVTLEGGGHTEERAINSYFLTIHNIDQDFNIKFEE